MLFKPTGVRSRVDVNTRERVQQRHAEQAVDGNVEWIFLPAVRPVVDQRSVDGARAITVEGDDSKVGKFGSDLSSFVSDCRLSSAYLC